MNYEEPLRGLDGYELCYSSYVTERADMDQTIDCYCRSKCLSTRQPTNSGMVMKSSRRALQSKKQQIETDHESTSFPDTGVTADNLELTLESRL